ncbi:MAG TPA: hypothetical protein VFQ76_19935 [Longimicrobiaceae bacterium]|nr:hypothetical protein [Longimicrobiaceae bacterium]
MSQPLQETLAWRALRTVGEGVLLWYAFVAAVWAAGWVVASGGNPAFEPRAVAEWFLHPWLMLAFVAARVAMRAGSALLRARPEARAPQGSRLRS